MIFMAYKPELLSPVGSMEALKAAVQNGADAVYMGGQRFNARQYASNFDDRELAQAIEYAHLRGVRVYITFNILMADEELEQAVKYLEYLYLGAGAVIVQDLAIAALAGNISRACRSMQAPDDSIQCGGCAAFKGHGR